MHHIKYARKMYHKKLQENVDLEKRLALLHNSMHAQRKRIESFEDDVRKIDSDIEGLIFKKYEEDL